ncbi:MAG: hypothetical protein AVDCRST_MAG95-1280 [uncultured Adhaeribacter sp.]|uniref:Uncharacterized protein n=1 Tax=uncultured Adhaeribacter sp. TaxID=448109 RepID=A0A6J4I116_9BACT|nr:MAG: hypothetical protein AVDCRST_MAG95-1280 [uncultured Adhaeribacter sp.]
MGTPLGNKCCLQGWGRRYRAIKNRLQKAGGFCNNILEK